MQKKVILLLFTLFLFSPLINAQEDTNKKDSIIVETVDAYVEYCLSSNSTIEFAKNNCIPIHYPTLIINNVIIDDVNEINTIRNTISFSRSLCGIINYRLGPYQIKQIKRYSYKQAKKKGIISQDGIVVISLQSNEILDFKVLETWLIKMEKCNSPVKKKQDNNDQYSDY